MSGPTRARREQTARELGERFGRSPRTIRRIIAEPREEFLRRAEERHEKIRELRAEGLSMRAIGDQLGISARAVHYALHKESAE